MNTFANNLPKKRGTVPNIEDSKQGHLFSRCPSSMNCSKLRYQQPCNTLDTYHSDELGLLICSVVIEQSFGDII